MMFSVDDLHAMASALETGETTALVAGLSDLPETARNSIEGYILERLTPEVQALVSRDLKMVDYTPFSEGMASEYVGRAELAVSLVVKLGGSHERDQYVQMSAHPELFPNSVCHNDGGTEILLMETIPGASVQEQLCYREFPNEGLIREGMHRIFQRLEGAYIGSSSPSERDSISEHIDRILERTAQGVDRLCSATLDSSRVSGNWAGLDPEQRRHALLEARIKFNGVSLPPLSELLEALPVRIRDQWVLQGFVHGDLQLTNVLLTEAVEVQLIDSDPDWDGGDYVWDYARYLQWFESLGWISVDKKLANLRLAANFDAGALVVSAESSTWTQLEPLPSALAADARASLDAVAIALGDHTHALRLDLEQASANLGLTSKPKIVREDYLLLLLCSGTAHLARLLA